VNSGEDRHASAYPAIVPDHNWLAIFALLADRNARVIETVVLGEYQDFRPEQDIGPYLDAALAPEEAMIANSGPVANRDTYPRPSYHSRPNERCSALYGDVAT